MTGPGTISSGAIAVFEDRGIPGIIAEGARATLQRTAEVTAGLNGTA
ncbi:hypothetical protein [Arthrobacter silvisoli]|nr:hypothetical protein [Arthrobacter silvisoli]